MTALVAFVEFIGVLWIVGSVIVLAAGAVLRRPARVTEWQAQCNARPTTSTVDRVYAQGVVSLADERAARRPPHADALPDRAA